MKMRWLLAAAVGTVVVAGGLLLWAALLDPELDPDNYSDTDDLFVPCLPKPWL